MLGRIDGHRRPFPMSADWLSPWTFLKVANCDGFKRGRSPALKMIGQAAIERQGMSGQFVVTKTHLEVGVFSLVCHDTHTS